MSAGTTDEQRNARQALVWEVDRLERRYMAAAERVASWVIVMSERGEETVTVPGELRKRMDQCEAARNEWLSKAKEIYGATAR